MEAAGETPDDLFRHRTHERGACRLALGELQESRRYAVQSIPGNPVIGKSGNWTIGRSGYQKSKSSPSALFVGYPIIRSSDGFRVSGRVGPRPLYWVAVVATCRRYGVVRFCA